MTTIADRLAKVRRESGLGVRPFAELITKNGYAISHGSVSAYESDDGPSVPAEYVATVARVFGKNPAWLLLGEKPEERIEPSEAEKKLERVREALGMTPVPLETIKPMPRPEDSGE